MARFAYGGQALMEGVLMRGKDAIGVAVRGPDGQIFAGHEPLNSILHRNRFARAPFFRGVVVLYETLVIGTRWLMRSGSLAAAGEGVAFGGKASDMVNEIPPMLSRYGRHPWLMMALGAAFSRIGWADRADAVYAELNARSRIDYVQPTVLAISRWLCS